MVFGEPTTIAPGVTFERLWWGDIFSGSKEALVASGRAKIEWFADGLERDRRGRVVRKKVIMIDDRRIETTVPARGKAQVLISLPKDEANKRYDREEAVRNFEEAKAREHKFIDQLPTSEDEFRERNLYRGESFCRALRAWMERGSGGFAYTEVALHKFDEAVFALLEVMRHAAVIYSGRRRAEESNAIRAETARLDPDLRRFLDQLGPAERS